jgi:SnoaL-like domain
VSGGGWAGELKEELRSALRAELQAELRAQLQAELQGELGQLRDRVGQLEDQQAVRALQFKYGYYMDKCLFGDIVELFADDATLYFLNGTFRGKEGARRLYGGGTGLNGPVQGMLFEHIIAQDVVDVAADRTRAWGRFRCFLQGGVHESKTDAPKHIPGQFWEAGIYENEYSKRDGIWRIQVFNYRIVYQATYEHGWAHSGRGPLVVSNFTEVYPRNARGPDELRPPPPTWPKTFVMPFHYGHPVTGKR